MSDAPDPFEGVDIDDPDALIACAEASNWLPPEDQPVPKKRLGGRVRIDWKATERIFVHGVLTEVDRGVPRIVYLPHAEIARLVKAGKPTIANAVTQRGWAQTKHKVAIGLADRNPVTPEEFKAWFGFRLDPAPEVLAAALAPPAQTSTPDSDPSADPRARSTSRAIEVLDKYVEYFHRKVEANEVKADNVADLDKAVRLLAFLKGEADRRSEVKHVITLEQMQARHAEARRFTATVVDDEVAGVLSQGDADAKGADDGVADGEFEDVAEAGTAA